LTEYLVANPGEYCWPSVTRSLRRRAQESAGSAWRLNTDQSTRWFGWLGRPVGLIRSSRQNYVKGQWAGGDTTDDRGLPVGIVVPVFAATQICRPPTEKCF